MIDDTIEAAIVDLLGRRSPQASICPSDVARSLAEGEAAWRKLMDPVRAVAAGMAERRVVRVTQGAQEVDLSKPTKGPVRIRRGANWPA